MQQITKHVDFIGYQVRKKKKNQNTKEKQDGMNSIIGGREIDTLPLFRKVTNII